MRTPRTTRTAALLALLAASSPSAAKQSAPRGVPSNMPSNLGGLGGIVGSVIGGILSAGAGGSQSIPQGPRQNLPPPPPGAIGPRGEITAEFMQVDAQAVLHALVASLPPDAQSRVTGIPLVPVTNDPRELNAYAGCTRAGRAFMAVTPGFLTLVAASAEARAYDEYFRGTAYDRYARLAAREVRAQRPVPALPASYMQAARARDPRKAALQVFLFREQLAFALGHELAHHYRGHTTCARGGSASPHEAGAQQVLARTVPVFNQLQEAESDAYGIQNALDAGARQPGAHWHEEGAMIVLDVFDRIESPQGSNPIDAILSGFGRTHPAPALRRPWVSWAAQQWYAGQRFSSGAALPLPGPGGMQLPGGMQFPAGGMPAGQRP